MNKQVHLSKEQNASAVGAELWRKREVATTCAMSLRMIDHLQRQGLPHIKFGPRCVRYPRRAVLEWLASRTVGGNR